MIIVLNFVFCRIFFENWVFLKIGGLLFIFCIVIIIFICIFVLFWSLILLYLDDILGLVMLVVLIVRDILLFVIFFLFKGLVVILLEEILILKKFENMLFKLEKNVYSGNLIFNCICI